MQTAVAILGDKEKFWKMHAELPLKQSHFLIDGSSLRPHSHNCIPVSGYFVWNTSHAVHETVIREGKERCAVICITVTQRFASIDEYSHKTGGLLVTTFTIHCVVVYQVLRHHLKPMYCNNHTH